MWEMQGSVTPCFLPHSSHICRCTTLIYWDLCTYTGDSERAKTDGLLPQQREIPLAFFLQSEKQELLLAKIPHIPALTHTHTLSDLKKGNPSDVWSKNIYSTFFLKKIAFIEPIIWAELLVVTHRYAYGPLNIHLCTLAITHWQQQPNIHTRPISNSRQAMTITCGDTNRKEYNEYFHSRLNLTFANILIPACSAYVTLQLSKWDPGTQRCTSHHSL